MKRFLLVIVAALGLAAPAGAKELTSVTVCGASECATIASPAKADLLAHMGDTVGRAAEPGGYYEVTFKGEAEGEQFGWTAFWVPGADLWAAFDDMVGTVRWSTASSEAAQVLAGAIDGLDPFPAPRLEGVRIDGRSIAGDPQSYLRLFEVEGGARATEPRTYDWVPVDLVAAAGTPWTMSDRDLMFSPSAGAIERIGARIALDDATARAIAAGEALPGPGRDVPWTPVLLALAVFALAVALLLARRVSVAPRRQPKPV